MRWPWRRRPAPEPEPEMLFVVKDGELYLRDPVTKEWKHRPKAAEAAGDGVANVSDAREPVMESRPTRPTDREALVERMVVAAREWIETKEAWLHRDPADYPEAPLNPTTAESEAWIAGKLAWVALGEAANRAESRLRHAALAVVEAEQGTTTLDEARSDLLGATEQLDLAARLYEAQPHVQSVRDAYAERARWLEHVAVPRLERAVRADERGAQGARDEALDSLLLRAIQDADWRLVADARDALRTATRAAPTQEAPGA